MAGATLATAGMGSASPARSNASRRQAQMKPILTLAGTLAACKTAGQAEDALTRMAAPGDALLYLRRRI